MNGFTKKRVGTMTLGERLYKLRSEKRLAMSEVSRITRIQVKYLEYLEGGNYDKLPADVYTKGFLRSYADFLGINEGALIKLYEKEKGIKKNMEQGGKEDKKSEVIRPVNVSSFVFTPRKIAAFFAVLLAVSGLVYLYRELGSFTDAPRLVILYPGEDSEVEGNTTYVEGITDKDARLFINDQPIFIGDDGKFRENITLQSGVNSIRIKALNKFDKEMSRMVTVRSSLEESDGNQTGGVSEETGGSKEEVASQDELQLEIRVDPGPVWLSVEADDNLVFSGTMLTGATQTFKAGSKITVNSGHANATFAKFNGKDIGALSSDEGAIRGVTFDKNTKY